jgi:hypothetical protein
MDVDTLLQQLKALTSVNDVRNSMQEEKRQELMRSCRKLSVMLETQFESMQRVVYSVCIHEPKIS